MLGSRFSQKNVRPTTLSHNTDPELIHREYYNPSTQKVILILQENMVPYIMNQRVPVGHPKIEIHPGQFVRVNHSFYDVYIPGLPLGQGVKMHTNFGDCIGKNIKSEDQAWEYRIKTGAKNK